MFWTSFNNVGKDKSLIKKFGSFSSKWWVRDEVSYKQCEGFFHIGKISISRAAPYRELTNPSPFGLTWNVIGVRIQSCSNQNGWKNQIVFILPCRSKSGVKMTVCCVWKEISTNCLAGPWHRPSGLGFPDIFRDWKWRNFSNHEMAQQFQMQQQ